MTGVEPHDPHVICTLADLLDQQAMTLVELSDLTGISTVNLSKLKNDHARAVRFTTLVAICQALNCQPGDLLRVVSRPSDADGYA